MFPEDSHRPQGPLAHSCATRYGLRVAGMRLAFPAGELLEYLPDAPIHRLPLAPSRLVGLVQLRGHPVAVFDFGDTPAPRPGERCPVLVVGDPARAAALRVDEAPRVLVLDEAAQAPVGDGPAQAPIGDEGGAWADTPPAWAVERVLGPALRDVDGTNWWQVEPARLFAVLAGEAEERAGAGEVPADVIDAVTTGVDETCAR